ncbi:MAG: hypothetical protein ACREJ4_05585 [Candidatus Methylomirabilaceae bacterium]
MPDRADHILQAQHNERFFQTIDKVEFSDWAMTTIFYAALHYIDAFLATIGLVDPGGHSVRDDQFHRTSELQPIARNYFRLKNRSKNARYYCGTFEEAELRRCYRDDLGRIKSHLNPLITHP